MNVEIGTEAAQFPEKKYINGIFVAVCCNGIIQCPAIKNVEISVLVVDDWSDFTS